MLYQSAIYFGLVMAFANLGLLVWVLIIIKSSNGGMSRFASDMGGRFDRIEHDGETLHHDLTEMDRSLRAEIERSGREGLAAAFDKVLEGTKVQADQLGAFGKEISELRGVVTTKLADAEIQAANGRASLVRDTTESIARARETIEGALKAFGDQQHQRLLQSEQAVREAKEATEASSQKTAAALVEQREAITTQLVQGTSGVSDRLGKELGDLAERVRLGFDGFSERLRDQQEQLREKVETSLEKIRSGNEDKLEQMRKAVDEQLQSALEKRLDESFQRMGDYFTRVQQAVGQVLTVTNEIGDLKRLFSNVKVRGGVGEDHLRVLLDDFLPAGAYESNFRISDESAEVVEFAVRMPRRGSSVDVWLPIDAKFPTEDFDRLVSASEIGDRDQEVAARRALERRIREEGKRISSKYIKPPRTIEFAIMYLPSESLYREVYRMPGLIEMLRREHSIHVMGPDLLPAYLHCVRVGYLTLALEQKAGEIAGILSAVKAEWTKLSGSIDTIAKRAETLNKGIRETQRQTRLVGVKLEKIESIEFERAEQVLALSDEALLIEADTDVGDDIPIMAPNPAPRSSDTGTRDAAE